VGLAIGLHILLILSLVKQFTGWEVTPFLTNNEYGVRKWIMALCILPNFFALDFLYFRTRKDVILKSYNNREPFTIKNISLILLMMFASLILIFVIN
jgi:hypothetical protein